MLNNADAAFIAELTQKLPEGCLRATQPADLEEPRGRYHGQGTVVARPESVEEVSRILRACHAARVGVVPLGGKTGLVGGQLKPEGAVPLLLSLERMRRIRAVYAEENVLIAEAGATLAEVQAAAEAQGRLFPLSLASEGTAQIGGNLSTNAGGVNVLRYGNTRELCLGLEAVLPDGSIWHGLKRLRKDNTGYDLRNLLVGAEGTLGVITAASLKLAPIPAARGTAFFVVPSPEAALSLLALAQARMAGLVSAFEMISGVGLSFVRETIPDLRLPFTDLPEWSVLMEVGLPQGLDPEEALAELYEAAAEAELVSEGLIAKSQAQQLAFWAVRENIPTGNRRIGAIASHDIALPLSEIAGFIRETPQALARLGEMRINCFGHLGDGNLHYNLFPTSGRNRSEYDEIRHAATEIVHDLVHARGGSVSAEHGIGRLKVGDLERYGDPARLAAMRAIKTALDPHGIMNPGAVLREQSL